MSLSTAALVAFAVWLAIKSIIIPWNKNSEFRRSRVPELAKIAWISTWAYLKRFAFITAITYTAVWGFLQFIRFRSSSAQASDPLLDQFFNGLIGFNERLVNINENKYIALIIVLGLILLLIIRRNAKKKGVATYEELRKQAQEGALPPLDPDEKMKGIQEELRANQEQLVALEQANPPTEETELKIHNEKIELLRDTQSDLNKIYLELDIRRRIIPSLEKDNNQNQASGSFFKSFLLFFTSQGMTKSLYKGSRFIGSIGLALLVLSFLTANKGILLEAGDTTIKQIASLQVDQKQQQIDSEWAQTLQTYKEQANSAEDWTEEDEEALDAISQGFEIALARSFAKGISPISKVTDFTLRANAVKGHVLKTYSETFSGTPRSGYDYVPEASRMATYDDEARKVKKVSEELSKARNNKGPNGPNGKAYRAHTKEYAQKNPAVWEKMKKNFELTRQSFSKPASTRDVLGMMVGESVEGAIDGLTDSKIAGEASNKLSKRVLELKMKQFNQDVITKGYDAAFENVESGKNVTQVESYANTRIRDVAVPKADRVVQVLEGHPPTLDYNQLDLTKSNASSQSAKTISIARNGASIDAVANFKSYFPGQIGMETETVAHRVTQGVSHVNSPSINLSPPASSSRGNSFSSKLTASRARSFGSLRGFRKIGGVLIGREAKNTGNTNVDFRDISWRPKGNGYEILLHRNDGQILSAGIFSKDIIHQSLAYVADGRPITVTMVTGDPFPFLKILVHPSLVNTDLGCKAIGLDRLVDKYANSESSAEIKKAVQGVFYQDILYRYACMKTVTNDNEFVRLQLGDYLLEMQTIIEESWQDIYQATYAGEIFKRPDLSHIASRPEYFNQRIVNSISTALKSGSISTFLDDMNDLNVYSDDLESLLKVETEEWSGVRELEYQIDANLAFLKPKSNNRLYPLHFMRQVVYAPIDYSEEGSANEASDDNPWEFPHLKNKNVIRNYVQKGINSDPEDMLIVKRMQSFAIAQRLFRAIFNGDLGHDFPIEKLADLARTSKSSVRTIETPTWNSGGVSWSLMEFQLQMGDVSAREIDAMKSLWDAQNVEAEKNLDPCN